jgi:pimeloyl-ACP methyl ester carboxylesterase
VAGVVPWGAEGIDFLDGMGEDNHVEFGAAHEGREPLRALLEPHAHALLQEGPNTFHERFATLLSPVDAAVLTGELAAYMFRCNVVGLERGVDGWLDDDLAFTRPWGFDLGAITVPTALWQGTDDLMVPFAHGLWLADHVAGVDAHLLNGEGHLSVAVGALDQMFADLAETI